MNDPLTITTLRQAIKGLPGKAVLVPSQIYSLYVKMDGEVIGYISDKGFCKFDKLTEELCPPQPKKDTNVQVVNAPNLTQISPTAPTPVANVDGCQTPIPPFPAPIAKPFGFPGES